MTSLNVILSVIISRLPRYQLTISANNFNDHATYLQKQRYVAKGNIYTTLGYCQYKQYSVKQTAILWKIVSQVIYSVGHKSEQHVHSASPLKIEWHQAVGGGRDENKSTQKLSFLFLSITLPGEKLPKAEKDDSLVYKVQMIYHLCVCREILVFYLLKWCLVLRPYVRHL